MNQNENLKKLQMNRTLAITLSLIVVVAVCVTAIAVGTAKKQKPPAQTSQSTSKTSQSTSKTSASTSQTDPKPNTSVVVEKVSFVAPMTAGNVIKEWSADVPVFSTTMEDYRLHLGIDVAASAGTPVYAVADGTVESVEFHPMMGQTVVITHADGYQSVYQNMQTAVPDGIKAGATVKAGDKIGAVGDTALIEISEEPHLHFELYKDGNCENPLAHFTVSPINAATDYEDQ
ncbi:MAG: M23 family metallopeptidase [Clostridia bacterium]|nr:M23 family metallopeptidase [Clostridia bacterium]